jgi:Esterase/lipase
MSELKKYLKLNYGELAPEVELPIPDDFMMATDPELRDRYNEERVAVMTVKFMKKQIYPQLTKIKTTDIAFDRDGYQVPVRIYHPEGKGPFPIVVFYHGGGWCLNSVALYDYVTRYIAKFSNSVVISVEYRLAPQYKFPTGLEDSYTALEWAANNASSFNGNPKYISVAGDSAGGNFSAIIAIMARDKKGPDLMSQILIYPATNLSDTSTYSYQRYSKGYFLEMDGSKPNPVFAMYLNHEGEAKNPLVSPMLTQDLSHLPHTVVISAECDPLVDDALYYAQRLSDSGVKVDYFVFEGMHHGFINETYGKTFEALGAICNMLKSDYKAAGVAL